MQKFYDFLETHKSWIATVTNDEGKTRRFDSANPVDIYQLENALSQIEVGSVVVRTFDHTKKVNTYKNGRYQLLPMKTVHGFTVFDGDPCPLEVQEMQDAYNTDSATGKPLSIEPDVRFAQAW